MATFWNSSCQNNFVRNLFEWNPISIRIFIWASSVEELLKDENDSINEKIFFMQKRKQRLTKKIPLRAPKSFWALGPTNSNYKEKIFCILLVKLLEYFGHATIFRTMATTLGRKLLSKAFKFFWTTIDRQVAPLVPDESCRVCPLKLF